MGREVQRRANQGDAGRAASEHARKRHRSDAKEISGESLAQEAAILIDKWTARSLTETVLLDIHPDVFNVSAPVAP